MKNRPYLAASSHSRYRGFHVERHTGAEFRWHAWDIIDNHVKRFRADTLAGLKALVRDYVEGESR